MNNLELIRPFLWFEGPDSFYYLQILQRKKDNPDRKLSSNNRVIKNYYINSFDYLMDKWDEITGLCDYFNARAMIRLNSRCYRTVAYKTLQNIANTMSNQEYKHIKNCYSKAVGKGNCEPVKTWVIDIDMDNFADVDFGWTMSNMTRLINDCEPKYVKILSRIPSPNGWHIISYPFNLQQFNKEMEAHGWDRFNVDIKKDNPTNLYVPNKIPSIHNPGIGSTTFFNIELNEDWFNE